MSYTAPAYRLPRPLRRHILHFEVEIAERVAAFAQALPEGARMLDAGAGEGKYAHYFARQRYCGVDLAVGDAAWDYSRLDVVADLTVLPFRTGAFHAAINPGGQGIDLLARQTAIVREVTETRIGLPGRHPAFRRDFANHAAMLHGILECQQGKRR